MGTICSTSRAIQVRENRRDNTCNPTPRKQHPQDTSYTHNYSSVYAHNDQSFMVTNKYALEGLDVGKLLILGLSNGRKTLFLTTCNTPFLRFF